MPNYGIGSAPDPFALGAHGLRNSWFDLLLVYIVGLVGFPMRRHDIPATPVPAGMILGPLPDLA